MMAGLSRPLLQSQGVPITPEEQVQPEDWAIHAQGTLTWQLQPAFRSPYQGPQSLSPAANGRETIDATLCAGIRPWPGGEIWINPEVDQGFGLSNTFGVAGFSSAEAYKLGKAISRSSSPTILASLLAPACRRVRILAYTGQSRNLSRRDLAGRGLGRSLPDRLTLGAVGRHCRTSRRRQSNLAPRKIVSRRPRSRRDHRRWTVARCRPRADP
jgi:hypothetical protein